MTYGTETNRTDTESTGADSTQADRTEDAAHGLTVRAARPTDYDRIIAVADDWWGKPVTSVLPRLFLDHFAGTSLVAEREGHLAGHDHLAGFVVGFLSPSRPDEAYIHFTGVAPEHRRSGLARDLYARFFTQARANGRPTVRAITSPQNERSIAFHTALGFHLSDPVPDYDGPTHDRVTFTRTL